MSDVRDDVVAAMDSLRGGGDEAEASEAPAADAADLGAGDAGGDSDVDAGPARPGPGDGEKVLGDKARDERGRFQPRAPTAPGKAGAQAGTKAPPPAIDATQTPAPAPATSTQTPPPQFKAPQSWRPELREKWAAVPPEVQGEIDRRERETAVALKEAAGVRQFTQQLQQALTPYEPLLRSFGPTPVEALSNALQSMHQLYSGPVNVRAKALATLIDQSGVPIEAINGAWSGEPSPQQGSPWADMDPQTIFQRAKEEMRQELAQQREQVARQQVMQEVNAFASDARNEFFERVQGRVAALMQGPAEMTLQQAYEEACWADPEVRKVLLQREAAEQAKAVNASTQRARAAASSVKSHPATASVSGEEPDTIHDYVRAAMRKHAGR